MSICKMTGIRNQIIISACMYTGQLLLGFNTAWTGPIITKLRDLEQSPLPYLLTETEISLIASLMYVGAVPGPYIIGWLSNVKGRKPCLILGGFISIVSYVLLAAANNLAMLYIGRIFGGLGIGTIALVNLVYIGEIASTPIRGVLLTVVGIFTTLGAILLFAVGPFFSYRVSTYVGLGLAVIFTLSTLMIPESPIFYILRDDEDGLVKSLQILGRLDDKKKLYDVKDEFKSGDTKMDWIELFTLKTNRRALIIGVTINIFQHTSGVMAVLFFSGDIFEMAGSSINSDISMIIIGGFQLFGSLVASVFIEKYGRKTLLIISTLTCSISMLSLGLYFYLDNVQQLGIENVAWLPLVILIIFFIGYDSGLGIIPIVLIGEMFTSNVRSKGSAVALTFAWIAGFLISTAFGILVENFGGHAAFWLFSCSSACAFLFTVFFIPETKGKSLLEIQKYLNKS
ncbi:facilitated trehalose transporter Tret1-like [Vanessa cardui]|uniref:facilitated trehalose transporter Tret1-like n=1 Tax=Vanessa cardui TaxID=171605 RepID=UPI001F136D91|nr:facilitated trehalose transporter Tret1-like [Vanessa cardui]